MSTDSSEQLLIPLTFPPLLSPIVESHSCNICYSDLSNNMVQTPCNHYYCSSCFFKWMRESQTCPDCRKLLVEDSHIESLITERKEELVIINKDITSQYNIFRFLRRDTDTLDKENAELLREKRELEYLVNTKKMELGDLKREKKAIKSSIRHINSYRQDLEELDSGS